LAYGCVFSLEVQGLPITKEHAMRIEDPRMPEFDRRQMLRIGAGGAAALAGLATMGRAFGQSCTVPPTQTEGPYWVDEMLNRSDIRSDPTSGIVQQGLPLRLGITVSETTAGVCAPLAGAYVDVWHCNASGVYSDTSAQGTLGQRFLRGYQVTDAHGTVRFLTIYPGWYMGRTIHIHFRVRKFSGTTVTFNFVSQFYFDQAVTDLIHQQQSPYMSHGVPTGMSRNTGDGLYNAQLLLRMAYNDNSHALASYNVTVNSIAGAKAMGGPGLTPTDEDSLEHLNDFGGGMPPLTALV
jgi:protocatechuate 3,4-dioxygenase beta subunit